MARRVAAWVAAYALVLQVLLTGIALASTPYGTSASLCLSATGSGDGEQHPDTGQTAQVHCQACLARADVAGLPPPVPTPEIDRVALELRFDTAVRIALHALLNAPPFQPRGPPAPQSA